MTNRIARACTVVLALALAAGCGKVSHDKIDDWLKTEKGPGKLRDALGNGDLGADLRAHAAQNLIRLGEEPAVFDALAAMSESTRKKIAAELAPRLWENARIDKPMAVPSTLQVSAKDALFRLRPLADEATRGQIDTYLTDWLTGGWYELRANTGAVSGARIIRTVGPGTGPRMIAALNTVIAGPADGKGSFKIGSVLLFGVAVTGDPEAVGKLLDLLAAGDLVKRDDTLPGRVVDALAAAYIANQDDIEIAAPAGLAPHAARLAALAADDTQPRKVVSTVLDLIGITGMPACLDPLVHLISAPHANPRYRWIAAQRALDCGKVDALVPVVEAFPVKGEFSFDDLESTILERVKLYSPRKAVAERARTLLSSDSWIARATGAEILARLGDAASAAEDVQRLQALAGDKTVLAGWWGDQEDVPAAKRKRPPTLGAVAREAAAKLQELAKSGHEKG